MKEIGPNSMAMREVGEAPRKYQPTGRDRRYRG